MIVPKNKQLHISDGVRIGKGVCYLWCWGYWKECIYREEFQNDFKRFRCFNISGEVRIGAYCNFRAVAIGYGSRIGAGAVFIIL